MSFVNKLNDTYELLSKLDLVVNKDTDSCLIKKQLLSVSEDLASYKEVNKNFSQLDKNEIKNKIFDILNRINKIEINVKNKIKITEKYNLYLNS